MFYNKATLWRGGSSTGGSIQFVSTGNQNSDTGSSVPITGAAINDSVFIWVMSARSGSSGSPSDVYISGYSRITFKTDREGIASLWYKRLTAVDTSAVISGGYDCRWAAITYVMRGVAASPVETASWYLGSSIYDSVNPPPITPTVSGSVVLALGAQASAYFGGTFTSGPSGFNNTVLYNPSMNTLICRVGAAWTPWTSETIDPGPFVYSSSSDGSSVIAGSVILLPG